MADSHKTYYGIFIGDVSLDDPKDFDKAFKKVA